MSPMSSAPRPPTEARSASSVEPRLRADAQRNRDQLLLAARDVFVDQGADAPLDEIARRAGVGVATLYRRFPDRQALARAVAFDVLRRVADEASLALIEEPDAFQALARYMRRALALRIGAVMPVLVGDSLLRDTDVVRIREELTDLVQKMIDLARAEGTLRSDVTFGDIGLSIIRLSRPLPGWFPPALDDSLAQRHLDLLIDGLRSVRVSAQPLSGPALSLADLRDVSSERSTPTSTRSA